MNSLSFKNVSVVYGEGTPFRKVALDNISLDLPSGEIIGVIGHTGSGKSTLAMLSNGLLKPTSGNILLEDKDIWEKPKEIGKVRSKVGIAFQYPEYQLFEETVYRDIAFGPKNMGLSEEDIDARVKNAAAFCGIDDELLKRSPFELSGGQKRRAAIAGVVAMEPQVLVLDEPAAGLDPLGREEILGGLISYHKQRSSTMVVISHSMEDIAKYCDRILVLKDGTVYMYGTVDEIFLQAELLFGASLDLPQITKLFIELKKRLLTDNTNVYTVKYAKKEIEKLLQKK
ncbi:MAG: energy-coupling factor transporter ATPase [Firmicutes bacterium HGW-Firmicutes-21]|nr:MAG: energy-coupling factor transporter ATPase [Firmicutes bacterium HGW-Firmicutes-21]